MRVDAIIKKLNNTELGKTGTHETYVQVPIGLDVSDIFPEVEKEISFIDKNTKSKYNIRLTLGREKRICGLGRYYRDKDLHAGDELLLEKRKVLDKPDYYISYRKLQNTIILRKDSKGYEVLTPERLSLITDNVVEEESRQPLKIVLIQTVMKRRNSQEKTNYYNVLVGSSNYNCDYTNKDLIEIRVFDNVAKITTDFAWKKMTVIQGE